MGAGVKHSEMDFDTLQIMWSSQVNVGYKSQGPPHDRTFLEKDQSSLWV